MSDSPASSKFNARQTEMLFEFASGRPFASSEGVVGEFDQAIEYVRRLVKAGANPNAMAVDTTGKGRNHTGTPLMIAISTGAEGNWPPVAALMEVSDLRAQRPDDGKTPLMMAIQKADSHSAIFAKGILEDCDPEQADNEGQTALDIACKMAPLWTMKNLPIGPLVSALVARVSLTKKQWGAAVGVAVAADETGVLRAALDAKFDFKDLCLPFPYRGASVPLLGIAAASGSPKAMAVLLEAGCDPMARAENGDTALIIACSMGKGVFVECAKMLLPVSDANAMNLDGETALMKVVGFGAESTSQSVQMLAACSDMNLKNNEGDTALLIAADQGNADFVKILAPISDLSVAGGLGGTAFENATGRADWPTADALMAAMSPQDAMSAMLGMTQRLMPRGAAKVEAALLQDQVKEAGRENGAANADALGSRRGPRI